jgi:hypothetical protein
VCSAQPPFDRHVDVLVRVLEGERARLELGGDGVEALVERAEAIVVDDLQLAQRAQMRLRARDVLPPQAPVEAQRRVEPLEQWILVVGKPGHGAPG